MKLWLAVSVGCAISAVALARLASHDPKRLRSLGQFALARRISRRQQRLLAGLALAPGLALILGAQWPALLIWFGALLANGWLLALYLARGCKSAFATQKPSSNKANGVEL